MIPEHLKKPKDRKKPLRKIPKSKYYEHEIQSMVEEYLKVLGVTYIRIPDATFKAIYHGTSITLRDKSVMSTYLKGLPDLTIFHPTRYFRDKYPIVLPLELKRENGRLSTHQLRWQKLIGTHIAYGFDEAKRIIDEFLQKTPIYK